MEEECHGSKLSKSMALVPSAVWDLVNRLGVDVAE